jgi:Cytochrome c oxidase subunit IV
MTAEVRVFARMAMFGVAIGIVYWFLTYETTGTVLLLLFGASAAIAALGTYLLQRAGRHPLGRLDHVELPEELEREPVPAPGWAPLGIAIGLGAVALGAAFGPWLTVAGVLFAIWSGKAWLNAAMRENHEARGPRRSASVESRGAVAPPDSGAAEP